jgi:tight adherence protein C
VALVGALVGAVAGGTRAPARRARRTEERRSRLRLELVTVDLLLALLVRAGAGPVQAVSRVVARGRGVAVAELAAVLASIRSGRSEAEAFRHAAAITPEPHAARTYRLFALAAEEGAALGPALLALAGDLQAARREDVRRTATRRRAAMLLPTIGVLAPVMLLFVVAPLPSVVLGAR